MLVPSGDRWRAALDTSWQLVEELAPPAEDALQVWQIGLTDAALLTERCLPRLTPEERDRADRYRVRHAREQFVVGRACLRTLLAADSAVRPEQVAIVEGAHGKPECAGKKDVSFNVAHCKGMVLIAMHRGGAVGIDVERVDRRIDVMETAQAALHPNERIHLERIADLDALRRAFFRCWTRKEAVVKADGRGLWLSLTSFEVPVFEASSAKVLISASIGNLDSCYFVSDLNLSGSDVQSYFVAAAAVESSTCRIDRFIFPVNRLK